MGLIAPGRRAHAVGEADLPVIFECSRRFNQGPDQAPPNKKTGLSIGLVPPLVGLCMFAAQRIALCHSSGEDVVVGRSQKTKSKKTVMLFSWLSDVIPCGKRSFHSQ